MATVKKEKTDTKKKEKVSAAVGKKTKKVAGKIVKKEETARKKIIKAAVVKKTIKPRIAPAVKKPKPVKKEPAAVEKSAREIREPAAVAVRPEPAVVSAAVKPAVEEKKVPSAVSIFVPAPTVDVPDASESKELEINFPISVKDLSIKLQLKPSLLIKDMMGLKIMASLNQMLDEQAVTAACAKYGIKIRKALGQEAQALSVHEKKDEIRDLKPRPPIVTFMGHVDHGKTSLLDAIRKSKVVELEHGGITQHIGAYRVVLPNGEITFLDTPGHEAFTAMRSRGARATDIVVLVVAADDGIMPQTIEAIDHARAAGVSIIVAINKIDKPQAQIDQVKKQLAELNLTSEDWGGKTITVLVSAKTGQGIDDLLEMILLESQMLELKANPGRLAKGVIIEAKMSKGRGPVATLLVQNGTLHLNQNIIAGSLYGKIRAMFDSYNKSVTAAGPAFPVEILGLSGVPAAGEQFFVIDDEKQAKELVLLRQEQDKLKQVKTVKRISLEELHSQIKEGKIKELKLIVKADVQGSLEAIRHTLDKLNVSEIKLSIIHEGVGNINSSDAILSVASDALIVGFNVTADELAKEIIEKEGVEVKLYNVIYELANEIKLAVEGMLEPKFKKNFLGKVEIRKVFKLSRSGTVAGCFVVKGKIMRSSPVRLVRNGEAVFEGNISSLKRFKDDVKEAAEGFECGITLAGYDNIQEGDIIEAYTFERIVRTLS